MTPQQTALNALIGSRDLADSVAQAAAGDAVALAAVLSDLNTPSITKTDATLKFKDDLIDCPNVGATNANLILGSLAKAGRGELPELPGELCLSEWHALNGRGTNVSRPGVQAMLTAMSVADNWPDGLADAVKKIGVWQISPAENAGLAEVTEADLAELQTAITKAAAAEALETARMELWQTWQDVYNQNISPVLDGTEPTVANLDAGIVAALAALRGE